ncbi:MAG: zinc ribbon domain-containing protein [Clostridia bacterium]|nr:zinc ribbon domain-containing protein [Clostridia bacterium]
MKCNNCSKELPPGSQFCPYCLNKFTSETEIIPEAVKKKENRNYRLIIITVIFLIALVIAAVIFQNKNADADSSDYSNTTESTASQISETEKTEITEGTYSVTDENGQVQYPPATYVVVVEEDGSVKQGYILPE